MAVALVNAPEGIESALGDLPEGAVLRRNLRGKPNLTLCIAWPKKASSVSSDLSQAVVRRAGLDAGLMDFKICKVDDTWSALRFTIPRGSSR